MSPDPFRPWIRLAAVAVALASTLALTACTTSPLGRRQLKLHSSDEMARMGIASFDTIKQQVPVSSDATKIAYVGCVANAVIGAVSAGNAPARWEVVVFEEPSANAFALPGGKIGVHTGLLNVAVNEDQLATVLGHEVGHVLDLSDGQRQALALLGLGTHFGITLPYSRKHETEADLIGLDIMARAGFEPRESVALWQNMGRGGVEPPEILSTHPSNTSRIGKLSERIPSAEVLRDQAHAAGQRPSCGAP